MKLLLLLTIMIILSGCVSSEYYTQSSSPGYNQQVWGALCEKCNRGFTFSTEQFNSQQDIQCPYCGQVQNLQMASNRYAYAIQQQQSYANQQMIHGVTQTYQDYWAKRKAQSEQRLQNMLNESIPGTPQYYERQKIEEMQRIRRTLER